MAPPEFRRERHSVTDLKIHLICITKYRSKVFTDEGLECIELAMRSVADAMKFRILEFNGEADHVHVLLEFPPKLSVSVLAKHLKGVSSRAYNKAGYPKPAPNTLWSPSYFASSVGGAPLNVVKQYIEQQARSH
ncbi:IS200/IS605 family transposase [cf. Phormidesmis sp. LEGE 11477]|uniref:IS200/IS605 family transposase n=1 Tax=cf. Phormidesmis sp. LEGE 11477 TaxID=1828680 RepID=UPI0018802D93|nr:IS200/IS605 family transposase [cf. Phormidesmis sp. LEGE 11477]